MTKFTLARTKDYIVIEFPEDVCADSAKEFEQSCIEWLQTGVEAIIFDFYKTKKLGAEVFPVIEKFKFSTVKKGIILASMNVDNEVKNQIIEKGVGGIFSIIEDLETIHRQLLERSKNKNILAPAESNLLLEAVTIAFKSIFGSDATKGVPFIKTETEIKGSGALSIVMLTETNLLGVVRFYFFKDFLCQLQEQKYNRHADEIIQKTIDDIESFSGFYFLQVQETLSAKNYTLQNVFPTVVTGKMSQLIPSKKELSLVLPFKSAFGEIWVEIIKV